MWGGLHLVYHRVGSVEPLGYHRVGSVEPLGYHRVGSVEPLGYHMVGSVEPLGYHMVGSVEGQGYHMVETEQYQELRSWAQQHSDSLGTGQVETARKDFLHDETSVSIIMC